MTYIALHMRLYSIGVQTDRHGSLLSQIPDSYHSHITIPTKHYPLKKSAKT